MSHITLAGVISMIVKTYATPAPGEAGVEPQFVIVGVTGNTQVEGVVYVLTPDHTGDMPLGNAKSWVIAGIKTDGPAAERTPTNWKQKLFSRARELRSGALGVEIGIVTLRCRIPSD